MAAVILRKPTAEEAAEIRRLIAALEAAIQENRRGL